MNDTIRSVAELLKAAASLLWPMLAFVMLLLFQSELRNLIRRLKRGKLLGQEIELEDSLVNLKAKADESVATAGVLQDSSQVDEHAKFGKVVIDEASQSPRASLLLLAAELEREVRELLASRGVHRDSMPVSFQQGLDVLRRIGGISPAVIEAARRFYDVRSRIIHGHHSTEDAAWSAIDSGLAILRAIQAIPREANVVYHSGVTLYSDPGCTLARNDVRGVILETTSPDGLRKTHRIYPTTKTHFVTGKRVAWGWGMDLLIGESWYKDPDTNEIKYAWTSSAEFIGRHLDDI